MANQTGRITTRRNHVGIFTATLVLEDGGRLHAWGATRELATEAVQRKSDNLQAIRDAAREAGR